MPAASTDVIKDPAKVAAGRAGARKRWGGQRILRLDQLTPEQRRLVLALIDAAKEAAGPAKPTAQEVSSGSSNTTAQAS